MNLKGCLSYLKLLINHIAKVLLIILFFAPISISQDTTSPGQQNDQVFVMSKSPAGALLRSAVVPGWGQLYNESYWKVPVVLGIFGYLSYLWIDNNNLYKNFQSQALSNPGLISTRNFYRDQRDLSAIYIAIAYILNMVDAYVDAHLFDFTVDESFLNKQPMLGIKLNF
jgi:hypothetical protein